jgi:hypothetical protein
VTTTTTCPSCGCAQPDGTLCHADSDALTTLLAAAPTLLAELDLAASRQARTTLTAPGGKGSAHERNPVDWTATQARDALETELAICGTDTTAVRRHPAAGRMLHTLATAITHAYRAIDRTPDRHYLGTCGARDGNLTCTAELWAHPGARTMTCTRCRTRHDVTERQTLLLHAARNHLATATDIANALTTLDHPITAARIRKWKQRGRLLERPEGSKLYRLGDVIDLLAHDHDRRGTATA